MIILVPLSFGLLFLVQLRHAELDVRLAILRASVLWGVLVVGITEGLSLIEAIRPAPLTLAWAAIDAALLVWLLRQVRRGANWRPPPIILPDSRTDRILLGGLGAIILLTGIVAVLAPVQTWDSLSYHMARVAEWANRGSVSIFPTGIERQNYMSPGAEFLVLQSYVLGQGDRWVNLTNWFVFIGCMLAGSWIAKRVETPRRGQILAAVFAGTIPLAIAQASGTATDIVLAFWCACAAAEAVYFVTDPRPGLRVWAYLGMSVGLAILTKPTAFAYVTPFLLWAGIVAWRRIGLRRMAAGALTAGLAVLLITSGYALRNTMTYGTLLGPQTLISQQANRLYTPAGVISNLVRNASLHLGTVGALNSRLTSGIQRLHAWLGLSPSDLRSTLAGEFVVIGPRNEDIIGNLVHTGLILLSFVVIWIRRKSIGKIVILLAACAAGAYLLFSVLYKWQLFGSRLQLPFFVLYAPVIGYLSVQAFSNRVAGWLGALLLVSALPWVLAMFSRPLVPLAPFTYPSSILAAPRTELYFANDPELAIRYPRVAESIAAERCTSIGLMLRGDEPEYLWWALLGAPKKPLEVEWIVAGNASAQYRNPNFQPCAIICTACPEEPVIRGVPLVTIDKGIRLYLQSAEEGRPEPHGPPSP